MKRIILFILTISNLYSTDIYLKNNEVIVNYTQLIDMNTNDDYEYIIPYKNIKNLNISTKDNLGNLSYSIIANTLNKNYIIDNNIGKSVEYDGKYGNIINKNPLLIDIEGKIHPVKFEDLVFDIDNILKKDIEFDQTNIIVNVNSPIKKRIKINNYFNIEGLFITHDYELHINNKHDYKLINKATITNTTKYNFKNVNIYAYKNKNKAYKQFRSIKKQKSLIKVKSNIAILGSDITVFNIAKHISVNNNSKNMFTLSTTNINLKEEYSLKISEYDINNDTLSITKYLKLDTLININNSKIIIYDRNQYLGIYKVDNNLIKIANNDISIISYTKITNKKYLIKIKNNTVYSLLLKLNNKNSFYLRPSSVEEIETEIK